MMRFFDMLLRWNIAKGFYFHAVSFGHEFRGGDGGQKSKRGIMTPNTQTRLNVWF